MRALTINIAQIVLRCRMRHAICRVYWLLNNCGKAPSYVAHRCTKTMAPSFDAESGMRQLNFCLKSAFTAITLSILAACDAQRDAELQWARAALERNPQVKVLAVDTDQHTVKLRIVATGEITTVTAGELAAIPIADLVALNNSAKQAAISPAKPAPIAEAMPTTPAVTIVEPPAPAETITATPAPPASQSEPMTAYKVEREDGRVRVNGPGVSIESAPGGNAASQADSQSHDDTIVCDGPRFMHIDGRHLKVAGDGIIARGGCELHITNSTVTASGTAITVLDATVHITNSGIRGDGSSLTTSSAAHVFLRNNKFSGLARRNPQAEIRELGDNTWR